MLTEPLLRKRFAVAGTHLEVGYSLVISNATLKTMDLQQMMDGEFWDRARVQSLH